MSKAIFLSVWLLSQPIPTTLWEDMTASTLGVTDEWSNKVEVGDINGDGWPDLLFANGGKYASAGTPQPNRVFLNKGPMQPFEEVTDAVLGPIHDLARVIKVRDLNGDGVPDIVVGTTYQSQSRLFLGTDSGDYSEVTQTHLPQRLLSVGDLEVGDVDADGDLDLVLADWGKGNPMSNGGGRVQLWLNDGNGQFSDVTEARMPSTKVGFSWDMELVDVDNDTDLDVLTSCKSCSGSFLFHNNGDGSFSDVSSQLPQYGNNYEFEPMDLNGDGFMDLVTINDGPGLSEHLFLADGQGGYIDATDKLWPKAANVGKDDNVAVFLDYDSDGDADFLIGSLSGKDRLLVNDGSGLLSLKDDVFSGANTPGTLGMAVADFDGDGKLDVVQSQGEVQSPEKLFLGVDIEVDTAAPVIGVIHTTWAEENSHLIVSARVHDNKSPCQAHDWKTVRLDYAVDDGASLSLPLLWYGEYYWRVTLPQLTGETVQLSVVAIDSAGNQTVSETVSVALISVDPPDSSSEADNQTDTVTPSSPESVVESEAINGAEPNDAPDAVIRTGPDAQSSGTAGVVIDAKPSSGGCIAASGFAPHSPAYGLLLLLSFGLYLIFRSRYDVI